MAWCSYMKLTALSASVSPQTMQIRRWRTLRNEHHSDRRMHPLETIETFVAKICFFKNLQKSLFHF